MATVGVGLIGTGFMGRCHGLAYNAVKAVFGDVPKVRRVTLCDVEPDHARAMAEQFDFSNSTTDWRTLLNDPEIDLISITTPNGMHKEMAVAALEAGKHVWCEKPMALTLEDAEAMAASARKSSRQVTMLGYNYVRNPALQHARSLIESGAIGDVHDFRGSVDEDYMADPNLPWSWRLRSSEAGLGTLGDLTCHLVSVAQFLLGNIVRICALLDIVHQNRPMADSSGGMGAVENDDVAHALVRFENGARGLLASSRIAHGRKNGLKIEVHGSRGTLSIDNERMNELQLYTADGPNETRGFRTILSGPLHPPYQKFCPAPGHGLGFNDLKVIELASLLRAIQNKEPAHPSFADGLRIERILHAFVQSAKANSWIRL